MISFTLRHPVEYRTNCIIIRSIKAIFNCDSPARGALCKLRVQLEAVQWSLYVHGTCWVGHSSKAPALFWMVPNERTFSLRVFRIRSNVEANFRAPLKGVLSGFRDRLFGEIQIGTLLNPRSARSEVFASDGESKLGEITPKSFRNQFSIKWTARSKEMNYLKVQNLVFWTKSEQLSG